MVNLIPTTMETLNLNSQPKIILIEPFYGGSHKSLIDNLTENFLDNGIEYTLVTLAAKKWHWRARCGALQLYDKIPNVTTEMVLFCSSVLNLAELLGLRPDLQNLRKVVYFHENQLVYPVQQIKERDVQYAYNQVTTSLVADRVLFNSHFNRKSFLDNISKVIKMLPDNKPSGIRNRIEAKSEVLYFPVKLPENIICKRTTSVLHVVWPHRWEFDKAPHDFFNIMMRLKREDVKFKLSILGETYTDVPDIFNKAKVELAEEIVHFGYLESKNEYFDVLGACHVVVSTAKHEFFGVSVLEAVYCGCLPLVPNNLVYPEIYPSETLYNDSEGLYNELKKYCLQPSLAVALRSKLKIDFDKYSKAALLPQYLRVLELNK